VKHSAFAFTYPFTTFLDELKARKWDAAPVGEAYDQLREALDAHRNGAVDPLSAAERIRDILETLATSAYNDGHNDGYAQAKGDVLDAFDH